MGEAPRRHRLSATDGWALDVLELTPSAPELGVAVVGHAMMVDRRTVWREDRPSLAGTLAARGWRVLVPDLRGHGESGPTAREGGRWSYDDLVGDTAPYVELAASLSGGRPVVLVGHSLFGHTALAWLGQHPEAPVEAFVALAVTLWGPWADLRRRIGQVAVMGASGVMARLLGRVPVRRLGIGSADEPLAYWRALERTTIAGRWTSADGGVDYRAGLRRVAVPLLHVLSEADRLAVPSQAARFLAPVAGREELRVGAGSRRPELRGLELGHMELLTSPDARPVWDAVGAWLERRIGSREVGLAGAPIE